MCMLETDAYLHLLSITSQRRPWCTLLHPNRRKIKRIDEEENQDGRTDIFFSKTPLPSTCSFRSSWRPLPKSLVSMRPRPGRPFGSPHPHPRAPPQDWDLQSRSAGSSSLPWQTLWPPAVPLRWNPASQLQCCSRSFCAQRGARLKAGSPATPLSGAAAGKKHAQRSDPRNLPCAPESVRPYFPGHTL